MNEKTQSIYSNKVRSYGDGQMKKEQSRITKKNKSSFNGWKWAFISLVSLILIGLFFLFRALQPVSMQEEATKQSLESTDEVSLVSTITTEDAETIMNSSIKAMITDEQFSYEVVLDEQLEIHSNVELFSFKIPYTLFFDPYVTEDGNLQLRADAIQLANFSLPVSAVLSLLAGELELPPYIGVDSELQLILIDFNKMSAAYDFGITMQKVDLENNDIQLKLSVNQATLIEAIHFENNSQLEDTN